MSGSVAPDCCWDRSMLGALVANRSVANFIRIPQNPIRLESVPYRPSAQNQCSKKEFFYLEKDDIIITRCLVSRFIPNPQHELLAIVPVTK